MKKVLFFLQLFKRVISINKLYTVVLLLIKYVGIFMLIFLMNNTLYTIQKNESNVYNREITVYPSQMTVVDWQYIEEHPDFETYKVVKKLENEVIGDARISYIIAFKNNVLMDKDIKTIPQNYSDDIVVNYSFYEILLKNDQLQNGIELEGNKYNIIGASSRSLDSYISYETFKKQYVPNEIVIYLTENGLLHYQKIREELSQRFLSTVDSLLEFMENEYISGALSIIIIGACLIILNEIFLYIFLVKKRRKEFFIYNILGLTRKQSVMYYNIELLLFSGICFILNSLFWIIVPHSKGLLPLLPYIFIIDVFLNIIILNITLLFTFRRK